MKMESTVIRVSPNFKKQLKIMAAESEKSVLQLTKELANDEKQEKKNKKNFFLEF